MIFPYKDKITIDNEISYFGFNFDRKSTKKTWSVWPRSVILRPNLRPLLKSNVNTFYVEKKVRIHV